jgi:acetoacetate decarboxylase
VLHATVQLVEPSQRPPRAVTLPLIHTRLFPAIDRPEPAVHELQLGSIAGFECGPVYTGPASLALEPSDYEELGSLAPRTVGAGYVFSMAFSVLGGKVEPA